MSDAATWSEYIPALTGPLSLNVAGYPVTIELTADQLVGVYYPLLAELNNRAHSYPRFLAGLAGIGGGGKTTFAAVFAHLAQRLFPPDHLAVVGMDGWHWPNAILDARTTRDPYGRVIPLRERKGGPESYDIESLAAALQQLESAAGPVALPAYDRRRHDPVPGAVVILPQTRIVVIEGNYVLGGVPGHPDWDRVASWLHFKMFLESDPDIAREQTIARHGRGGLTPDEAVAKYEINDRLNADLIRATARHADYLITLPPIPRFKRRES